MQRFERKNATASLVCNLILEVCVNRRRYLLCASAQILQCMRDFPEALQKILNALQIFGSSAVGFIPLRPNGHLPILGEEHHPVCLYAGAGWCKQSGRSCPPKVGGRA